MLKRMFLLVVLGMLLTQCARRGSPTGGPKDETPPVMLRAVPPQKTVGFKEDRIRIYFDEYIKLNKLQEQLVISPPLEQTAYLISPQSVAAKYIEIAFMDTLSTNTTYTFNFGESVVDNNEENPYSFFSYVFSTGAEIDSLQLRGSITDALDRNPESFVSIMLYPVDSTYSDSTTYKNKPLYYTNTLDSLTSFSLPNLKAGTYAVVALKDAGKNFLFDPSVDKIDAVNDFITLPNDSLFELRLFKEESPFDFGRAFQAGQHRIGLGYKGDGSDIKITLDQEVTDSFVSTLSFDKKSDTLYYWYRNLAVDTLRFTAHKDSLEKSYIFRIRNEKADSLAIEVAPKGVLHLTDTIKLTTNTPIKKIMRDSMQLRDKDSVLVDFDLIQRNKHEVQLVFNVFPNEKYRLEMLPGTLTDFFDVPNDTISVGLSTKSRVDYGNVSVRLQHVPSYPLFVDILNEKEEMVRTIYLTQPKGIVRFEYLMPNKYYIRVRLDENNNGMWDTGNYLEKKKPEAVYHFPPLLDVRANWELQESFSLE
jgi:hypothetical protein